MFCGLKRLSELLNRVAGKSCGVKWLDEPSTAWEVVGGHLSVIQKWARVSQEELDDNLVTKWSFTPECQFMVAFCRNVREKFSRGGAGTPHSRINVVCRETFHFFLWK